MKPALRKKVAGYLQDRYRVSTRKAAHNGCVARATMYYKKKSDPPVQSLRIAIRDAASKRPRFGRRRILVLVRRDGHQVEETRLLWLYREEGLALRQKSPRRRRRAVVRQPKSVAAAPNEIRSMDLVHDRLSNGRNFRLLTAIPAYTRGCITLEPAYGFKSTDVISVLRRAIPKYGKPQTLRCGNGSEFTATEFDQWARWNKIAIDFSRPGKPADSARVESFDGRVRQELLNPCWGVR